jgi:predicted component of type VI protein secretion system
MKFSKLVDKVEKIVEKQQKGKKVKPKKIEQLEDLLAEKISRYEARLEKDLSKSDRGKLEARLKVVRAQLRKAKDLEGCDD